MQEQYRSQGVRASLSAERRPDILPSDDAPHNKAESYTDSEQRWRRDSRLLFASRRVPPFSDCAPSRMDSFLRRRSCPVPRLASKEQTRTWGTRQREPPAKVTSSERRGTGPCRSACARTPRPLFRADRFQSWVARRSVRRSAVCLRNRLGFPRPSPEWFDFH